MSVREKIKIILEEAGLKYVSNSMVEDILKVVSENTMNKDSVVDLIGKELVGVESRLQKIEKQLGL